MSEKEEYINDPEKIRLNDNQELQQILGNPPGWLLRWGNTFVLGGAIVFLTLGWLIKYPDAIPAKITLTTLDPPIRVFAETSGKLMAFNVSNHMEVEEGTILAELENTANLEDVDQLDSFLIDIQNIFSDEDILNLEIPRNLRIGDLQSAYSDFSKRFDEHVFFLKNNNTSSKVYNFRKQIRKIRELNNSLSKQIKTLQEEVALTKRDWDRSKSLREMGGISETELEKSESTYLKSRRQLETLSDQVTNNDLLVEKTKMQIIETQQDFLDNQSSGSLAIKGDIQKMHSEIDNWKKTFLIRAPIGGKVSLTKFQSAQQFIESNEELLTIVPIIESEIVGKGVLPRRGSGKIRPDMRANIRLDGYPYQEFGIVECSVNSISLVPQGEGFIVELNIPQPLMTTYNKAIPFQQEMQGTANIITEDRRILERVFDKILSIIRND